MNPLPVPIGTDARIDHCGQPNPVPAMEIDGVTRAGAHEQLQRHADNPSAFLALNRNTFHFALPGIDGFIAYRPHGRFLFQLGGCVAPPAAQRVLLDRFRRVAHLHRRQICAVQLQERDIPLYREHGFCVNQMGMNYTIDLRKFSASGSRFIKLRNKMNQARRAGIEVVELGANAPRSPQEWNELASITRSWLITKGGQKKLVEFMVGEMGEPLELERRVFAARMGGRIIGFVSFVPVYGSRAGLLHDLTRRQADAPAGVMDLINMTAIERFQQDGIEHLHFGLSPFAGLDAQWDCIEGKSRLLSQIARLIYRHGDFIYPSRAQEQYKLKWHPHYAAPEYIGFEAGFSLVGLWRLMQLTRII
jgi:lysylphosphatidylglycerol synthetase-like protein (DUF2156 family)